MQWRAPQSPAALLSYLIGTWTVAKDMQYQRGGKTGTFSGVATFSRLTESVVTFEEQGTARLAPDGDAYEARQRLLYTHVAGDQAPSSVRVLFDEASSRESAAAVLAGARFFHTIEFVGGPNLPPFNHPCGPDMYRGRIALDDECCFRLLWGVSGPRKLGIVVSTFRRVEASSEEESTS